MNNERYWKKKVDALSQWNFEQLNENYNQANNKRRKW